MPIPSYGVCSFLLLGVLLLLVETKRKWELIHTHVYVFGRVPSWIAILLRRGFVLDLPTGTRNPFCTPFFVPVFANPRLLLRNS